jgi:hypothetical protein
MTENTKGASRRNFLKLAVTAAPAAAVIVAGSSTQVAADSIDLSSDRMQDTAHTRAYLESTRF